MAVCTPSGTKDLPALPKQEMFEQKKAVFRAFPKYSPETEMLDVAAFVPQHVDELSLN